MRIKQKAQTATEYLVILAIVVVIALIVIGVLGESIGIGGSAGDNIGDLYFSTTPIGITDFVASASSNHSVVLKNNNAFDIIIHNITVGGTQLYTGGDAAKTISSGGEYTVSGSATAVLSDPWVTCSTAGDSFSVTVALNYTNVATSAIYAQEYDRTVDGTCAQ